MKQAITIFCFVSLFFQPAFAADLKPTLICGRVINAGDSSVVLTYLENPMTGRLAAQRTVLTPSSFFSFRIEIGHPVNLQLEIPGFSSKIQLFAEAGDSIFLVCDGADPIGVTRFSGNGAAINQLINELATTTGSAAEKAKQFESGHDLSVSGLRHFYDSIYQLERIISGKWLDQLSPEAMGMARGLVYFTNLKARLEYFIRERNINSQYPDDLFEQAVFFPSDKELYGAMASGVLLPFVDVLLDHAVRREYPDDIHNRDDISLLKYKMAGQVFMSPLKEYAETYLTYRGLLTAADIDRFYPLVEECTQKNYTNAATRQQLQELFEGQKRFSKGQPVPGIKATMMDGTALSFDRWKGKVIYVDFWASWCVPCRKEMPNVPAIKEQFKGEDVVFVYISIDAKETNWKKAIVEDAITGEHAIVPAAELPGLIKNVITSGIPRYMIIGKDGKLANAYAPGPGEEKLLISELETAFGE